MTNNMKIEISEIIDNKGEVFVKNEEWINYYNQYYEMNFTQISGGIKMHGFRKGNIPSILLEIKYPHLVEEANQRSTFMVLQTIYMEVLKKYPNAKIDNYKIDEYSKNFIMSFSIKTGDDKVNTEKSSDENHATEKSSNEKKEKDIIKKTKKSSTNTNKEPVQKTSKTEDIKVKRKKTTTSTKEKKEK